MVAQAKTLILQQVTRKLEHLMKHIKRKQV